MITKKYNIPSNRLVGKRVGYNLYLHKSMMHKLPEEIYNNVVYEELRMYKYFGNSCYNIIKINMKNDVISLIFSDEFDDYDEPGVDFVWVMNPTKPKELEYFNRDRSVIPIYHHKWMLVDKDYTGFDVGESKERSEWWTNHPVVLKRMKDDKYFKSKIGLYGYWSEVLKEIDDYDRCKN